KPQLDDLRLLRILDRKDLQSLVDLENLLILGGRLDGGLIQFHFFGAATALESELAPGAFDQDAAHRLRGRSQKMSSVLPRGLNVTAESKPGLMHQGSGLKRLA